MTCTIIGKETASEESPNVSLNKYSNAFISIACSDKSSTKVLEELLNNKQVILLEQNQVSEEIFFAHYVEEISGDMGLSFKVIVCLQCLGQRQLPCN